MFPRREGELARSAPARQLDIRRLVGAVGDILCGEIGERGKQIVEFGAELAVFLLERWHRLLDLGDFGFEAVGGVLVALAHRLTDRLRGLVAAALRLLQPCGDFAAAGVERQDAIRSGLGAAALEPRIEFTRMLTDKGNVVHGQRLCPLGPRLARGLGRRRAWTQERCPRRGLRKIAGHSRARRQLSHLWHRCCCGAAVSKPQLKADKTCKPFPTTRRAAPALSTVSTSRSAQVALSERWPRSDWKRISCSTKR